MFKLLLLFIIIFKSPSLKFVNSDSGGNDEAHLAKRYNKLTVMIQKRYEWQMKSAFELHECEGFIYKAGVIITAAHCFIKRAAGHEILYSIGDFFIVAGSFKYENDLSEGNIHEIKSVKVNTMYDPREGRYDIAIVYLENPLTENDIGMVKLPSQQPVNQKNCVILRHINGTDQGLNRVQIESRSNCKDFFENKLEIYFYDYFFCGYYESETSAQYKFIGEPLFCNDELVGIVSHQKDEIAFTNIYFFNDWIESSSTITFIYMRLLILHVSIFFIVCMH